jgi:hypothetical protein
MAQAGHVFISYSRADKDRVLELTGKLRGRTCTGLPVQNQRPRQYSTIACPPRHGAACIWMP